MIIKEAQTDRPALVSLDKRIPPEIWQRVFSWLYPSQLSRLSMVNKTFYSVVSSLAKWSEMFFIAHSQDEKRLRTLRGMPESKSYMLYMCAMSLYTCEHCFHMAQFTADRDSKPKQHQAPMRTLINHQWYAGQELDMHWTISMCNSCAVSFQDDYMSSLDSTTRERLLWYRTQP